MISFYPWQLDAWSRIEGQSAVLAAPTGSGKTLVAYLWAGLLDSAGQPRRPEERVIFTAPIKALSNERYLDLRGLGFEVGLETGDFKKNAGARVLCCTQEIYTLKYAGKPGIRLVVDEFHYIFTDSRRARTYVDGIRATSPEVPILVMSATFGNPEHVRSYLARVTGRPFVLVENEERATELVFREKPIVRPGEVRDALVFVFSREGVKELAEQIAGVRRSLPREMLDRLEEMARIFGVAELPPPLYKGVGLYHGSLLPKEKLLVETAFRERILDVVVGTNALALGVNLPAETVLFAQLAWYHDDRPLSRNEFLQMAGRAGRKGHFDTGYVTWIADSPWENRNFLIDDLYRDLLFRTPEPARIDLAPAFGRLLREETTPSSEAETVAFGSLPERDYRDVYTEIRAALRSVDRWVKRLVPHHLRRRFRAVLGDIWFEEMEVGENLQMAWLFCEEERPSSLAAATIVERYERNRLQALLKIKRFANALPEGYSFARMGELEAEVERIDETVFTFEECLQEISESRSETPLSRPELLREKTRSASGKRKGRSAPGRPDGAGSDATQEAASSSGGETASSPEEAHRDAKKGKTSSKGKKKKGKSGEIPQGAFYSPSRSPKRRLRPRRRSGGR